MPIDLIEVSALTFISDTVYPALLNRIPSS